MNVGTNVLIQWLWKEKVTSFLIFLHFSFGVGAFCAAPFFALFRSRLDIGYYASAGLLFLCVMLFVVIQVVVFLMDKVLARFVHPQQQQEQAIKHLEMTDVKMEDDAHLQQDHDVEPINNHNSVNLPEETENTAGISRSVSESALMSRSISNLSMQSNDSLPDLIPKPVHDPSKPMTFGTRVSNKVKEILNTILCRESLVTVVTGLALAFQGSTETIAGNMLFTYLDQKQIGHNDAETSLMVIIIWNNIV